MPGTNPLDTLALLEQQSVAELDAQEESSDDDDDEMLEEDSEAGDELPSDYEIGATNVPYQIEDELHPSQAPQLEVDEPSLEDDEQVSTISPSLLAPSNGANLSANPSDFPQPSDASNNVAQHFSQRGHHGHSPASSADDTDSSEIATSTRTKSPSRFPFNLLQTGETDICLFRDILYRADHPNCTRVCSQQTLHQKLPPGLHHLSHIERLNMIAQIPELGIVLIGNQAGRVGVLTTTYWQATQQAGYKVEHILPFKSQEEKRVRPEEPLMGMAVSPLQGHEYRPDPSSIRGMTSERASPSGLSERRGSSRRFRLLMMYYDHTVLSYEISRPSEEEILVA